MNEFRSRFEPARDPAADGPAIRPIDGWTWLTMAGGLALAGLLLALPWPRFALGYLTILIHEIGHALCGWLFGYPSIPAFDLVYGGGVTTWQNRSTLLLAIVYLALASSIVAYRRNRATRVILLVGLGLFALLAQTDAHQALILFMGHGMELAIAGLFLYRALSGSAVVHAAERPLYAACGFFIVFSDIGFAHTLWASPAGRAAYEEAKGGGHWMDFSRLAEGYLHVPLGAVAFLFLLCCLLPIALSFLTFRYQEWVFGFLARLIRHEPAR